MVWVEEEAKKERLAPTCLVMDLWMTANANSPKAEPEVLVLRYRPDVSRSFSF